MSGESYIECNCYVKNVNSSKFKMAALHYLSEGDETGFRGVLGRSYSYSIFDSVLGILVFINL